MATGTNRRLRLGVVGVLLALGVTVLVQVMLLRANTTAAVAEAYGIAVGFGLAMPLLQGAARPTADGPTSLRARTSVLIALGSLAMGVAVVTALLSLNVSGNLTVAGGAAGAYIGGMLVHSYLTAGEDQTVDQDGTGAASNGAETESSPDADPKSGSNSDSE